MAARGHLRVTQLGLPLLIAARLHLHAAATLAAGYLEDAKAWREWLLRSVAGGPSSLQIMYAVDGTRRLPGTELPWLHGYEKSSPVRTGNCRRRVKTDSLVPIEF